jgi:hypothetical protein
MALAVANAPDSQAGKVSYAHCDGAAHQKLFWLGFASGIAPKKSTAAKAAPTTALYCHLGQCSIANLSPPLDQLSASNHHDMTMAGTEV